MWFTDAGAEVGASPLSFDHRLIEPGSEATYSDQAHTLTSGTIQGAAHKARIELTELEVVTPTQQ